MNIVHLVLLALVQAVTEFVPVSSSGHLILIDELSSVDSSLVIDVALHVGTLIALIIFYRKKLTEVVANLVNRGDNHLFWQLVVATIPAVIVGVTIPDLLEDARTTLIVVTMLIIVGLVMLFEKHLLPKKPKKKIKDLTLLQSLYVGIAQAVALVPGTSRSGSSIIGGRLVGLNNKDAADFAFLVGVPAIAGAALKVMLGEEARNAISSYPLDILLAVAVAAVVGLFAIKFVLRFVKEQGLKWFGVYRIALALGIIIFIGV